MVPGSLHMTDGPTPSAEACPPGPFIIWGWLTPAWHLGRECAQGSSWEERCVGWGQQSQREGMCSRPGLGHLTVPSAPHAWLTKRPPDGVVSGAVLRNSGNEVICKWRFTSSGPL